MSPSGDFREHWGRKLLAQYADNIQDGGQDGRHSGGDHIFIGVVGGVLFTLTLVIFVAFCACGESDNEAKLKNVKKKTSSSNLKGSTNEEVKDVVEVRPVKSNGVVEANGVVIDVNIQNNVPHSRQSQASSTSSQMRPTSLRELPELPSNSTNENPAALRSSDISDHDYDHLNDKKKQVVPLPEDYDHINLESPAQISEASPSDQMLENHYAQVRDRTYEACNGAVKNYPHGISEPPYNRIRDDSPYTVDDPACNAVKDSINPYNTVKDHRDPPYNTVNEPPYNTVNEPPYNTVNNEPPYNTVNDGDPNDPYNHINENGNPNEMGAVGGVSESHYELEPMDSEDPYTMVDNDDSDLKVTVISLDRSSGLSNSSEAFHVPGSVSISGELMPLINAGFGASNYVEEITEDDYAVVNKERNPSTTSAPENDQAAILYTVPPEPPRAYRADEIPGSVLPPPPPAVSPPRLTAQPPLTCTSRSEREYSKVTARESLASMSARHALNPYEIVVDSENTYATVDGGSGDGVITKRTPAPPSSPIPIVNNRQGHNQPTNRHLDLVSNETYAEIGTSGGASSSLPPAPVPPSLDSLHSMKKHERRHLATPEDTSLDETIPHTSPAKRTSFSPTTALPGIPIGMTSSQHDDDDEVTMDPNYQTVKDSIDETEYDPNYESVEDAKAKFPSPKSQRQHHYEEVSPSSSQPTSPNNVRTRVLNRHTYEDIDEVKEKGKRIKNKDSSKKGPKS